MRPPTLPLIVLVGPTAIGKSALAIELALDCQGEVVSADSRQVYRYMDIGTAKPTLYERWLVPHHLLDLVDPDEEFNQALFQELATVTIANIQQRGRVPILVGGTGLYVWSIVEGLRIPPVPPNPELRRTLEARAAAEGYAALHADLATRDPVAAAQIDPRNVRRVIRALEVCLATGQPFSSLRRRQPPPYQTLIIGLTAPRDVLYRRIDERVVQQVKAGLVEETRMLVEMGYGYDLPSMSGLGHRQMGAYLRGEISLAEAIRQDQLDTHRFARHQMNWFRLSDPRIHWLDITSNYKEQAYRLVARFLAGEPV